MGSFSASLKTIGDSTGLPATVELHEGRLSITAGEAEIGKWALDDVELEPTTTGYKLAAEGDQVLIDMSDSERFAEELEKASKNGREKRVGKKKRFLFSRKEKLEPETKGVRVEPISAVATPKIEEPVPRIPASVMGVPASRKPTPLAEPEQTVTKRLDGTEPGEESGSFFSRLVAMFDRAIDATEKRWGPLLPGWVFNRIVFLTGFTLVVLAFVFRGTASVVLLVTGVIALMIGGAAYTDDVMASKLLPGRATPTHLLLVGVGLLGVGIAFGFIA